MRRLVEDYLCTLRLDSTHLLLLPQLGRLPRRMNGFDRLCCWSSVLVGRYRSSDCAATTTTYEWSTSCAITGIVSRRDGISVRSAPPTWALRPTGPSSPTSVRTRRYGLLSILLCPLTGNDVFRMLAKFLFPNTVKALVHSIRSWITEEERSQGARRDSRLSGSLPSSILPHCFVTYQP